MDCLLVFNKLNDLVFWRWRTEFVTSLTAAHCYRDTSSKENECEGELNPDVVIQIFSPIIASQRIMTCQFSNSYTSVQCRDGTNMVFDEYVGYLFVLIGKNSVASMQQALATCISIIKYFCGPDLSLLKHDRQRSGVNLALTSWERLSRSDQATLLGTSESLNVSPDLTGTTLGALKAALSILPQPTRPAHAAIFIGNKFLSLYTSRGVDDLTSEDLLFLGILCNGAQDSWTRRPPSNPGSRSPSPSDDYLQQELTFECDTAGQSMGWTVLLGNGTPYGLQLVWLARGVTLILINTYGGAAPTASPAVAAIQFLAAASPSLAQRDVDMFKQAFNNLDSSIKKLLESLKKHKGQPESPQRKLQNQWDSIKKCWNELVKNDGPPENWLAMEAAFSSLFVGLRTTLHLACQGFVPPDYDLRPSFDAVQSRLGPVYEFLQIKAMRNFTLGSSPAMSKYVEEFPGLVHFLHIDRTFHRLTAPALPDCKHMLSRKKIWKMVERGNNNLRAGHTASMWKDSNLHYVHLLWWEDVNGSPLKPRPPPVSALPPNNLPIQQYYMKLTEICFPGNSPSPDRVRCWELYAVHLGLLPAGTALAHVRRLAATVCDLRAPPHPANLL